MNIFGRRYREEEFDGDGGGGGEGEGGGEGAATFPDTWRQDWAGDNEKMVEHLSRYASPQAAIKAGYAASLKIDTGEYKKPSPFPEEGTDEEKNSWRSEHGIPESFDKYDLGRDVPEEDKDAINSLLEFSHGRNATPEQVKTSVDWYYDNLEKQAEARAEKDKEVQTASEDALRAELGEEYRSGINRIHGLLDTAPEGVKDKILNARFEDGTPFGSDPDALRFLLDVATQINPVTTLVPPGGNVMETISDEITHLKTLMGDKNGEYWKGPKAEGHQQRYRDLLEAQLKMKR